MRLLCGRRTARFQRQIWRAHDGGHGQLGDHVTLLQHEMERTDVGDFQGDLAAPAGVNGWGGEVTVTCILTDNLATPLARASKRESRAFDNVRRRERCSRVGG
jgi:hypothetical protein